MRSELQVSPMLLYAVISCRSAGRHRVQCTVLNRAGAHSPRRRAVAVVVALSLVQRPRVGTGSAAGRAFLEHAGRARRSRRRRYLSAYPRARDKWAYQNAAAWRCSFRCLPSDTHAGVPASAAATPAGRARLWCWSGPAVVQLWLLIAACGVLQSLQGRLSAGPACRVKVVALEWRIGSVAIDLCQL